MGDFWVFGYGSLMWNPGFETLDKQSATLYGLHRSLCIRSWVHRGTRQSPGLVLGLDKGGSCKGIALKAPAARRQEVVDYLRARELVTDVYLECWRNIRLESGETAKALVYRADRNHQQYGASLSWDDQFEIVRSAVGQSGANPDYVRQTVMSMHEAGIKDRTLEYICTRLDEAGL